MPEGLSGCRIEGFESTTESVEKSTASELFKLKTELEETYVSQTEKICPATPSTPKSVEVSEETYTSDGQVAALSSRYISGVDENRDGTISRDELQVYDLSQNADGISHVSDADLARWNGELE